MVSTQQEPQFPYRSDPISPLRLLEPHGALLEGCVSPLDDEQILRALRLMMLSRAFDQRGISLHRQGRFGTFSPVLGQEASVVGSAFALDPSRDWIVPQYRELPALLHQGLPLEQFILYFNGHPAGGLSPTACGYCLSKSLSRRSCRMRSALPGVFSYKELTELC